MDEGLYDSLTKLLLGGGDGKKEEEQGRKGRGLVNGTGGKSPGLTNGEGLTNGMGLLPSLLKQGLVNGDGFTKARGKGGPVSGDGSTRARGKGGPVSGDGFTRARGRVNGLVNGNGLTNGRGRVNGLVNGMGLTNGIGKVNGLGLINGTFRHKGKTYLRKRSKPLLKALFVIMVFLIPTVLFFLYIDDAEYIKMDGRFGDWAGVSMASDPVSDTTEPNVDISEYGLKEENDLLSFYMEVDGKLFSGGPAPMNRTDVVNVFIDGDSDASTGYRINGMGADNLIHIYGRQGEISSCGLFTYDDSRGGGSGLDWNAYSTKYGTKSGKSENKMEVQVHSKDVNWNGNGRAFIFCRSFTGAEDVSDHIIGEDKGLLVVNQESLERQLLAKQAGTVLLNIDLEAVRGDARVDSLTLTMVGNADITSIKANNRPYSVMDGKVFLDFTEPIKLKKGETEVLEVTADLQNVDEGRSVGFRINSLADIEVQGAKATLRGSMTDYVGYVGSVPGRITIDGAFGDWSADDMLTDPVDADNENVDITQYGVNDDSDAMSFYLKVEGDLMAGLMVPAQNPQIIPSRPSQPSHEPADPTPPGPSEPVELPVNMGEDTVRIFIDTDNDITTGYNPVYTPGGKGIPAFPVGAEYMLETTGKNGHAINSGLNAFAGGVNRMVWSWEQTSALNSASDHTQYEAQVPFADLGLNGTADVGVYYWVRDWRDEKDDCNASYSNGQVSVIKPVMGTRYFQDRVMRAWEGSTSWTQNADVYSVATGDMNNDGDMDIVVGRAVHVGTESELFLFDNDGSWTSYPIAQVAGDVNSVALADFDNDGLLDIVIGADTGAAFEVVVYQTNYAPLKDPPYSMATKNVGVSLSNVNSVATGDFDLDGDPDIALGRDYYASSTQDEVLVWENGYSGGIWSWTSRDVGDSTTDVNSVAVADFDNDAYPDIVSGADTDSMTAQNEVVAWETSYNPAGIPPLTWKGHDVHDPNIDVLCVDVGDLNNDGMMNIVAGFDSSATNEIICYDTDGSFSFKANDVGSPNDQNVHGLAIADIDRDGWLDIMSSSDSTELATKPIVSVWENDHTPFGAAATWEPEHVVGAHGTTPYDVDAADFDNDGDFDLVSVSGGSAKSVIVWENVLTHRNMPFDDTGIRIGTPTNDIYSVAIGDMNNDGDLDVVSAGALIDSTNEVIVWKNGEASATFDWASVGLDDLKDDALCVALGDMDNDGDLDIIVGTGSDEDYEIVGWENQGSWVFKFYDLAAPDHDVNSIALGDLDNDGWLDIVSGGSSSSNEIYVWQNDKSPWGTWGTSNPVANRGSGVNSVAVADMDNDGDLDIVSAQDVVIMVEEYEVCVWYHDGKPFTGSWTKSDVGDYDVDVNSVALADFNNDGLCDIATGSDAGGNYKWEVLVWENLFSSGTFSWKKHDVGKVLENDVYTVAATDFDNDGYVDIAAGSAYSESDGCAKIYTYRNEYRTSAWTWTQASVCELEDSVYSVAAGDITNPSDYAFDGDDDIVSGTGSDSSPQVMWWKNKGGQVMEFVDATSCPGTIAQGTLNTQIMKIVVKHNGISGDESIELNKWIFVFTTNNVSLLLKTELSSTFSAMYIYYDSTSPFGSYNAGDAVVSTVTTFSVDGYVPFSFSDPDANVLITATSSKTFFLVVDVQNTAPYQPFVAKFKPDGYDSTNGYNEVENDAEDSICTIQECGWTVTQICIVNPPELHYLALPVLGGLMCIFIYVKRRKRKK